MFLKVSFLNTLNVFADIKRPKEKYNLLYMDDVRGDLLGPPHNTTPAAVIAKKYNGLIL